jgi:hypothetical protein
MTRTLQLLTVMAFQSLWNRCSAPALANASGLVRPRRSSLESFGSRAAKQSTAHRARLGLPRGAPPAEATTSSRRHRRSASRCSRQCLHSRAEHRTVASVGNSGIFFYRTLDGTSTSREWTAREWMHIDRACLNRPPTCGSGACKQRHTCCA